MEIMMSSSEGIRLLTKDKVCNENIDVKPDFEITEWTITLAGGTEKKKGVVAFDDSES